MNWTRTGIVRNTDRTTGGSKSRIQNDRPGSRCSSRRVVGAKRDRPSRGRDGGTDRDVIAGLETYRLTTGLREDQATADASIYRDVAIRLQGDVSRRSYAFNRSLADNEGGRATISKCYRSIRRAELCVVGARSGLDGDVGRIKQQHSEATVRRPGVHTAIEGQIVLARDLNEAAISARCTTDRGNATEVTRRIVRPDGDVSAVPAIKRISIDRRARADKSHRRVLLGACAVEIAADQDRATACIAGRVDGRNAAAEPDAYVLPENLDGASGRARVVAFGFHRAGDADDALVAAVERDGAVAHADAVGADDAVGVDDGVEQRVGALGGHEDVAAVGFERAAVHGGGVERGLVDGDLD